MGTPTSAFLGFFCLSIYPTLLLFTSEALFTTIFLSRHNKQDRTFSGITCHYLSLTSQGGCHCVTQHTPQPWPGNKDAVSTSSKQENSLLSSRYCSLVRRVRIKCIAEPSCLKKFRFCFSRGYMLLICKFPFERFCAHNRLWGQNRGTALRQNAGNNNYFQASNIFAGGTNIYL